MRRFVGVSSYSRRGMVSATVQRKHTPGTDPGTDPMHLRLKPVVDHGGAVPRPALAVQPEAPVCTGSTQADVATAGFVASGQKMECRSVSATIGAVARS